MMRLALLLAGFAAALGAEHAHAQAAPEILDLVLPQGQQRIRVEIISAEESPTSKWNTFLDRWFDYFDADDDGALSRNEASRIFPVPLPDRQSVPFDFAKADADGDGKITRAELKTFYRSAGFTPVLGVARPTSLEDLQIADAMFRHLGPDKNGSLTIAHFKRAVSLLRKLDENEDEVLTMSEVLSLGVNPALKAAGRADFTWKIAAEKPPAARIKVALNAASTLMLRVEPMGKSLRSDSAGPSRLIRHEQAVLAFAISDNHPGKTAAISCQFVLAQFRDIAGKSLSIEKGQVADDPSLQLLADVFPHADRNQDGKLTHAELERFLALIEQGVRCQLVVTLTDCGRNLFRHLDQNGDGRLDVKELRNAADQANALGGANGWTGGQVPHYLQVKLQSGFTSDAFGPLPLATPANRSAAPAAARSTKGPAWFHAMDKNGDGFLSPREFLGPLELFQQLDRNGDGLISLDEAELAEARRPGAPLKR